MVGARPAVPEDDGDIAKLRARAADEARSKRGGMRLVDAHDGDPDSIVVGTIGDAVVGYASVTRRNGLASLAELFTEPEARGVGVGDSMLRVAEALASQWGCAAIESVALPGDRDTKNFFEAHGMVSRLLLVSRTL
jgi:GNAT superfamily N-acetyltransferase